MNCQVNETKTLLPRPQDAEHLYRRQSHHCSNDDNENQQYPYRESTTRETQKGNTRINQKHGFPGPEVPEFPYSVPVNDVSIQKIIRENSCKQQDLAKTVLAKSIIFSTIKGPIKIVFTLAENKIYPEILFHIDLKRGEEVIRKVKMHPENQKMFLGEQGQSQDQGSKLSD